MLEEILLRIARRGPGLNRLAADDTAAAPADRGSAAPLFPASAPADRTAEGQSHTPSGAVVSMWEAAKKEHYLGSSAVLRALSVPAAFVNYSTLHAELGRLIWSERHAVGRNIVHVIRGSGEVVAAVYPKERTVAVSKKPMPSSLQTLIMKELPASARPFEAQQASQFETISVPMLLWYFGQTVHEAVEEMPEALIKGKLLLRKLPLITPNALHMRHLHLIHLFSAGPIRLPTLLARIRPEAVATICADLTSLYFTGCLVLNQPPAGSK